MNRTEFVGRLISRVKYLMHYMIIRRNIMDAHVLDKEKIQHRQEFCEFRYGIPASYQSINDILRWLLNPKFVYGKTWRCWSKKPSEELMKNTPWND